MEKEFKDRERSITLTNDEWAAITAALYIEKENFSRKREGTEDLFNATEDQELVEVIANYQEWIDQIETIRKKITEG